MFKVNNRNNRLKIMICAATMIVMTALCFAACSEESVSDQAAETVEAEKETVAERVAGG